MTKLTRELLADYARVLNEHGPNSQEAKDLMEQYAFDSEFQELARIATTLKSAIVDPVWLRAITFIHAADTWGNGLFCSRHL